MAYDNSQLQTYKDCPERYRLKYLEELRKMDSGVEEHDREFGSAVHKGLEAHYKGLGLEKVKEVFSQAYPLQLNEEDKAKTLDNGITLLTEYAERYKEEDKGFELIQNEVVDEFEIAPGITFLVKVDLVVRKQGCMYALDHKTTKKSFGWDYWGQFEPNPQVTAQTAYVQAKWGECSVVIINGLSLGWIDKPKLLPLSAEAEARQYSKVEKKYSKYYGEEMWYVSGFHCEFQRQLFNRNKSQVEAWKQDTVHWIEKVKAHRETIGSGVWPKNEGQCRFCSYKEVCISFADEQVIEQLYERHDALEYLKGE